MNPTKITKTDMVLNKALKISLLYLGVAFMYQFLL